MGLLSKQEFERKHPSARITSVSSRGNVLIALIDPDKRMRYSSVRDDYVIEGRDEAMRLHGKDCQACNGSGRDGRGKKCTLCGGSGKN